MGQLLYLYVCLRYFLLLTFVLLAKFHSQSSVRENSCRQRFFAGRHCCSFQFVIIQDRNFNAVGKHQLQPCELGPGKDSPGQWSAHTPPRPSRQSVLCLVTCGLLCLSSGEHFEFYSEAGAQIKDRQIND